MSNADKKEGVLQMRTSTLFDPKNVGFSEIYGVSAREEGGSASVDKEGGG